MRLRRRVFQRLPRTGARRRCGTFARTFSFWSPTTTRFRAPEPLWTISLLSDASPHLGGSYCYDARSGTSSRAAAAPTTRADGFTRAPRTRTNFYDVWNVVAVRDLVGRFRPSGALRGLGRRPRRRAAPRARTSGRRRPRGRRRRPGRRRRRAAAAAPTGPTTSSAADPKTDALIGARSSDGVVTRPYHLCQEEGGPRRRRGGRRGGRRRRRRLARPLPLTRFIST